ncbi:MAG: proline iminopeptidase-family hydrolase [Acidimicrobiales bacterium]
MNSVTGTVDFKGHQTWYRIVEPDEPDPRKLPLVTLHGGPGASHQYLLSMIDFANFGRRVIFYDQLGCGNSTHLPDADPSLWTPELFADELDNLVEALDLTSGYHILGQSWGGMLAQEHAVRHPRGLRSVVLSNTAAAFSHFIEVANELRNALPDDVRAALDRYEATGDYSNPEYLAACDVFYRRHVCRLEEWPDDIINAFAQIDEDPTVYHTMNGPSEFHVIGTAKDWSAVDRLHLINVPTLVVCGRFDEAAPSIQGHLTDGITDARLVIFEQSSHMPFWEERELYMHEIEGFLNEVEDITVPGDAQ